MWKLNIICGVILLVLSYVRLLQGHDDWILVGVGMVAVTVGIVSYFMRLRKLR